MANKKREATSAPGKGFDLAEQQSAIIVPDLAFLEAFHAAGVFGCAYGLSRPSRFSREIPTLTLVGDDGPAFRRVFEAFQRWGGEEDGDCIDVLLLLYADGTYAMMVGPERERLLHRTLPQADLYRWPGILGASYVKRFDTTHPLVRDLIRYRAAAFSPIALSAATCDRAVLRPDAVRPLDGLPTVVKYDVQIVDERTNPGDERLIFGRPPKPSKSAKQPGPQLRPSDYPSLRKRTLDVAFPVSRERVLRSGLVKRVRALPGFDTVTETQVIQGAINVMLSDEIAPGDLHYRTLEKRYEARIWEHVLSRYEAADGRVRPAAEDPAHVARQIDLDVRHVMKHGGASMGRKGFPAVQARYRKLGYVDD